MSIEISEDKINRLKKKVDLYQRAGADPILCERLRRRQHLPTKGEYEMSEHYRRTAQTLVLAYKTWGYDLTPSTKDIPVDSSSNN